MYDNRVRPGPQSLLAGWPLAQLFDLATVSFLFEAPLLGGFWRLGLAPFLGRLGSLADQPDQTFQGLSPISVL